MSKQLRLLQKYLPIVALGMFGLVWMAPLFWTLAAAFVPTTELLNGGPLVWLQNLHFGAFEQAWSVAPFARFYLNTIIWVFGLLAIQLVTISLAGFRAGAAGLPRQRPNLLPFPHAADGARDRTHPAQLSDFGGARVAGFFPGHDGALYRFGIWHFPHAPGVQASAKGTGRGGSQRWRQLAAGLVACLLCRSRERPCWLSASCRSPITGTNSCGPC